MDRELVSGFKTANFSIRRQKSFRMKTNYLVDTHYVVWCLIEPRKIRHKHLQILADADSPKFISTISFWEIALKYSLGKLELVGVTPEELVAVAQKSGFHLLDLNAEDLASSHRLPLLNAHRDPFDRLIIWQCIRNDMILMTADDAIKGYLSHGLKLC